MPATTGPNRDFNRKSFLDSENAVAKPKTKKSSGINETELIQQWLTAATHLARD